VIPGSVTDFGLLLWSLAGGIAIGGTLAAVINVLPRAGRRK
jgi:hypothetical protein